MKYPPKLQIGAGISKKGKTKILVWKGRGDFKNYCERLKERVVPFIKKNFNRPHRFLHDLDTTHKLAYTKKWIKDNGVKGEFCPVRSPDLNAIEYVWNVLEKCVIDYNPTSEEELEQRIKEEWKKIDQDLINHTIDHVIHTIHKIIKASGNNNYEC